MTSDYWRMMKTMKANEAISIFKETQALLDGHFELRSGLHSDRYFQCALVLQYPVIAEKLCAAVIDAFREAGQEEDKVDAVISPALGGIPVGHEVARQLGVRHIFAEKQAGGLILRRGFKITPGERLIVAEDVVTRGGRVQQTADIVRAAGGIVAAYLVLVDRSGGTVSLDAPLYSLVQMTPTTWDPTECPLCKQGIPIDHPGS